MPPRLWVRSDNWTNDTGANYLIVLLTFSVTSPVVFALVVVMSLGYEVRTPEFLSLNFVNFVFALPEFSQLRDLVSSQSRRQRFDCHVGPRPAVARSPEPMAAIEIIVAPADEKDVIGNTHRDVHLRLRHLHHCRRRVHNHRRRLADMDVYANLSMGGHCKQSNRQDQTQQHPASCRHHKVHSFVWPGLQESVS